MNLGMVEIRGLDIAIQTNWELPKQFSIDTRLTYTYQKAQAIFTNPKEEYYRRSNTIHPLAQWLIDY